MQQTSKRGAGRWVALCGAVALSSGCAIINPYRDGDDTAYRQAATLANAVSYAEDTREEYYDAIFEQTFLNRSVGVALVGVVSAATFLGVTGGGTNAIAGLGVGGAGLFAANSLLYSHARLGVYVAGAKAISCTLGVYAPARAFDAKQFDSLLASLPTEVKTLQSLVDDYRAKHPGAGGEELSDADDAVRAAERSLARGFKAQADLNTAGVRLYEHVQGIHADVTKSLIATEPDLSTLVNTLGTSLPTNARLLVSNLPNVPTAPKLEKHKPKDAALAQITAQTGTVEEKRQELEELLAKIPAPANSADLAACAEFAKVRPFQVRPQPSLVIDTGQSQPGQVIVSGGTPPYGYGWLGQAPGGNVELKEAPAGSHSPGLFALEVTPDPAAAGHTHQLYVEDADNHSAAILVNFVAGGGRPAAPNTGGQGSGQPAPGDPALAKIQFDLVNRQCMALTRTENGKQVTNIDGLWGQTTEAAVTKLAKTFDANATVATLFGDRKVDKAAFDAAVADKLKELSDSNQTCS